MIFSKLLALAVSATPVLSASLQAVSNWGSNPTNLQFYIYVPDKLATNPAIIVGLHPCGGSAQGYYGQTKLPSYADKNGFILVYPGTTQYSNCWDVQNAATLTHGAGGDALGIVNMVSYTLTKYNGNKAKVYVTGSSSGAMMTNILAGSYPDVFEAGSAYSGVAHACFAGSNAPPTPFSNNQTCAQGLTHTAAEWANYVHNSYPAYTGRRTRMQIWHGLADTLVRPQCAREALKQWAAVNNLTLTKSSTGVPSSAWQQDSYGDGSQLVGYFGTGVGHFAPTNEDNMLKFFGLI